MDFSELTQLLKGREEGIINEKTAFKSSVLLPLVYKNDEWHMLFEKRSLLLKSQPGDVCFPGGRLEQKDPTPMAAAIRETSEELGIPEASIEILGSLEKFVPTSHMILYPFIGIIHDADALNIEEEEVAEVFTVPLSWLLQHEPREHIVDVEMRPRDDFPFQHIPGGRKYKWRSRHIIELFYHYGHYTIWGMTARILQHFLSIIQESSLIDHISPPSSKD